MKKSNLGYLTDRMLAKRILERIRWDKRVSTSDIQVVSRFGNVILKGLVDSSFRREAAQEIALNTEGVMSVDNLIIAPSYFHRSDAELKSLIEEKLMTSGLADTEYISVDVVDGNVKLDGLVHCPRKKAQASGFVWELSGVLDCLNMIEISDAPRATRMAKSSQAQQHVIGGEDYISFRFTQSLAQ